MISPYEKIWSKENLSCSDAWWYILRNYGPLTDQAYGCGIKQGMVFIKNFFGEFYLPGEETLRCVETGRDFFLQIDP